MNYTGNIKDAWHALDADGSGKVPSGLVDWIWETQAEMGKQWQ